MLQCIDHPSIFGAGDCVSLIPYPELEKNGVHAVRQGPILWHNILAYLDKKTLRDYKPQSKSLAILSTGKRTGLLLYGNIALSGSWTWQMKNRIDRSFIRKFSN